MIDRSTDRVKPLRDAVLMEDVLADGQHPHLLADAEVFEADGALRFAAAGICPIIQ